MNIHLVDVLIQAISALLLRERSALEEALFFSADEPTSDELVTVALQGGSFDFLEIGRAHV